MMPISIMNESERQQVVAYLKHGTYQKAATECGVHWQTVSRTWKRWRKSLAASLEHPEKTLEN